ncbi:DUF4190 domain-containing protein [Sesbania bispinosa]|nr:DUF4190 domain-containing protein [Sesbania bispinosa]
MSLKLYTLVLVLVFAATSFADLLPPYGGKPPGGEIPLPPYGGNPPYGGKPPQRKVNGNLENDKPYRESKPPIALKPAPFADKPRLPPHKPPTAN